MQRRRLFSVAFLLGFLLHSVVVATVWLRWGAGLKSVLLVWMDAPWSLLWLGAPTGRLLALSLVVGGLWWGALTSLLTFAFGRLTAARPVPR
ncbi:MAG TPA: hypothetical protein VF017_04345 [Thermoanaerobaculia bacterium]|nr:hypothetical protein [Thermoanaerobaculia bacterium]